LFNSTEREEKAYLSSINELIEDKYVKISSSLNGSSQDIAEMKKEFWENIADMDGAEKAANREQIHSVISSSENTADIKRDLEKLRNSPYFARIDYKDDSGRLPVYIGIKGFRDEETKKSLISDWRAPISSVFYDCEIGPASFNTPDGVNEGHLELKRQYKISSGEMQYMIESNISIDDEVLQKELSSTSDEKMKNIVATIQKEQNEVIRNENAGVLIIQGAAGSGKTSIALHRIAFMLYRYKNTISSSDMLVLSPNKVFGNYISNVLPELGEDNIQEIGFEEIAVDVLGKKVKFQSFAEQVSCLLEENDPEERERIEYKSTVDFLDMLDDYLSNLERDYFKAQDVKLGGVVLPKHKITAYMAGLPEMPLKKKMDKTARDMARRMKDFFEKKHREWKTEYAAEMKRKIEAMFRFRSTMEVYENFYTFIGRPELFRLLPKRMLEYSDVFPMAYTKIAFESIADYGYVRHLLVDEMQDYTPVQYAVIGKLFRCKMTILGDSNQAVNPYSASSIEKISSVFPESECIRLCKSYRSTIEISDFAQAISTNPDIVPVERHGELPVVYKCETEEIQTERIRKIIDGFRTGSYKNLGIICRTQRMAEELYGQLKGEDSVSLLDFTSTEFTDGIIITSAHMSKGLEFDQVLIPNVSDHEYHTVMDQKMLYVACTRAMHKLDLTYVGEKTRWIL